VQFVPKPFSALTLARDGTVAIWKKVNAAKEKSGFTLAEVLVTIALIAVLAAVLLPALNKQLGKGDASRVATDLKAIETGINTFYDDVHRYPSDLTHLTTAITTAQNDIFGNVYTATNVAKWRGPYVSKDVITATGLGTFTSALSRATGANNASYITVNVTGITADDFAKIEDTLDEGNSSSTSSTSGVIHWSSTNTTLTYFAVVL
jgi:type IV pilus assembly protein PilE